MTNENNYIIVRKSNFILGLIVGFIILIIGGIKLDSYPELGFGMMGFGFGICLLLLEQRINSIGKYKV
jgi:hypothetical protein